MKHQQSENPKPVLSSLGQNTGQAGKHKIVLGSDTPYGKNNLKMNIQRIRNLPIPGAEKKLILGENIQKLLTP